jgi:hypothetical protein
MARAGRNIAFTSYDALVAIALDKLAKQDFEEALRSITSTISKCVKVKPKLKRGSPQHTLLVRRLKALRIASALIVRELNVPR